MLLKQKQTPKIINKQRDKRHNDSLKLKALNKMPTINLTPLIASILRFVYILNHNEFLRDNTGLDTRTIE